MDGWTEADAGWGQGQGQGQGRTDPFSLSLLGCPLANSAFISEERAELTVSDTSSLFESESQRVDEWGVQLKSQLQGPESSLRLRFDASG